MLESKAVIGDTDMLQNMQQDALHLVAKALDLFDIKESTDIACFIKKDFDRAYGQGWRCRVGTDYGSSVTHCHGCFICFRDWQSFNIAFPVRGKSSRQSKHVSSLGDCRCIRIVSHIF